MGTRSLHATSTRPSADNKLNASAVSMAPGKPTVSVSNPGVEKLKGVFSAPSFITIGDNYMKKTEIWPRLKGKNKIAGVPKKGRTCDVYFDKQHKWLLANKKYADWNPTVYRIEQPRDQRAGKGKAFIAFNSTNANRKGEYGNVMRCGQWEETLGKEMQMMKQQPGSTFEREQMLVPEHNREFLSNKLEADSEENQYETPEYLYDIGREANTEFQPKDHREIFYSKHKRDISELKKFGPLRTHVSSLKYGWGHQEVTKYKEVSEYAAIPIIRSTFYRRTGLPLTTNGNFTRPGGGFNQTFTAGGL